MSSPKDDISHFPLPLMCCFIKFTSSLLTHVSGKCGVFVCKFAPLLFRASVPIILPSSIQFNKFDVGGLWNCATGSEEERVHVSDWVRGFFFKAMPHPSFKKQLTYGDQLTCDTLSNRFVLTQMSKWLTSKNISVFHLSWDKCWYLL